MSSCFLCSYGNYHRHHYHSYQWRRRQLSLQDAGTVGRGRCHHRQGRRNDRLATEGCRCPGEDVQGARLLSRYVFRSHTNTHAFCCLPYFSIFTLLTPSRTFSFSMLPTAAYFFPTFSCFLFSSMSALSFLLRCFAMLSYWKYD